VVAAPSTHPAEALKEGARPTTALRTLTGSQILWDALEEQGVEVVFGYPGGAIMPAYDALPGSRIRHVLVRHEQGAAHMADGYARASGRVVVAVATSGPGATNLVTGIANAMIDSIPIVCISGQVPSTLIGSDAFQETDFTGVTLPITKHNFLVTRAQDIMPAIKQAFYIAGSGRPGPVVVDITKDAQNQSIEYKYDPSPVRLPGYRPDRHPLPEELKEAVEMITAAKRPIIFCGHGVIRSNATSLLLELVHKTNIPVALTLLGLGGFPAQHERSLGMMGMHGEAGWFGPRGLASIVLALTVAHEEPDLPALDVILAATTLVVLASVVLHGASAHALTQRFSGGDG
jgi:acetolactate synthase-1/2/3 large subunit